MTIGSGIMVAGISIPLFAFLSIVVKTKNGNNGKYVNEKICGVRHQAINQRLDAIDKTLIHISDGQGDLKDIIIKGLANEKIK